jgi:hypothetical protein
MEICELKNFIIRYPIKNYIDEIRWDMKYDISYSFFNCSEYDRRHDKFFQPIEDDEETQMKKTIEEIFGK